MKYLFFTYLILLIFIAISCNKNVAVKVIEEHDPVVKIMEERDSMVVFPRDTIVRKPKK